MIRRIFGTACVTAILPTAAWIGGYDFDSRGFWPAYLFILTASFAALAWCVLGVVDEKEQPK